MVPSNMETTNEEDEVLEFDASIPLEVENGATPEIVFSTKMKQQHDETHNKKKESVEEEQDQRENVTIVGDATTTPKKIQNEPSSIPCLPDSLPLEGVVDYVVAYVP